MLVKGQSYRATVMGSGSTLRITEIDGNSHLIINGVDVFSGSMLECGPLYHHICYQYAMGQKSYLVGSFFAFVSSICDNLRKYAEESQPMRLHWVKERKDCDFFLYSLSRLKESCGDTIMWTGFDVTIEEEDAFNGYIVTVLEL